jgi:NAD(P)-dependent dehydrogenase (short-subunit alcohol dehydrogenase family)
MPEATNVVVIGGTAGLGKAVAAHYAGRGFRVTIAGRDATRTRAVAEEIGGDTDGIAVDLSRPETIPAALAGLTSVDHLVLTATSRTQTAIHDFDATSAAHLVTTKLVGYTQVVHALAARLSERASIVLFGGLAKDRPYPGSTTLSIANSGVTGLANTLVIELAPVRVNSIHPAAVADSPHWLAVPHITEEIVRHTPTGRLPTTAQVTAAVAFLLENEAINGIHLLVDGGLHFH